MQASPPASISPAAACMAGWLTLMVVIALAGKLLNRLRAPVAATPARP